MSWTHRGHGHHKDHGGHAEAAEDHAVKHQKARLLFGGVLSAAVITWGVGACSHDDHERCVDSRTDTVIGDAACLDTSSSTSYAHWYRGGSGYGLGSHVSGGDTGSHGVARGGFGAHAGSGGSGGEGGHGGGS